jgi:hypothetical protein
MVTCHVRLGKIPDEYNILDDLLKTSEEGTTREMDSRLNTLPILSMWMCCEFAIDSLL